MGTNSMPKSTSRRRVLILSSEFPPGPGGIGTHAYQLARHLAGRQWDVHIIAPQSYVSAADRDRFNRQQPFAITPMAERLDGPAWPIHRLRSLVAVIRDFKPGIIVATGRRALWMAAALQTVIPVPWVAVGHGSEFRGSSKVYNTLTRLAIERAAAVIAVSNYTAGLIRDVAVPRRLVVIPNAADGERFHPGLDTAALRVTWGVGENHILLTVGRVSDRKAQDVVIRAMPHVSAEFPDAVYIMAGLPGKEPEFSALAAELGVADKVRFVGLVPDEVLPAAYSLADLFILVSREAADGDVEGYGIVVQEAALSGVPAVVSRGCGLTEAISEGFSGVSVPPDDPEATAVAIIALLRDEERRRLMGRQARDLALKATWTERVAEYDHIFRELLAVKDPVARPHIQQV